MGRIVESTFMSLDGVIDRPQDWSPPYWDEEHAAYAQQLLFESDALLLGRKTYEGFADAWSARSGDPFTERINSMPKYVASRTLTDATWNATLLQGDAVAETARLKEQPTGGNLLKYGTGEFSRALMDARLVDEYHFWIFPVVAGKGDRLFEGHDITHLQLVDTTRFASGIVVLKLVPK